MLTTRQGDTPVSNTNPLPVEFANAMMAMHDHIHNTKDVKDKTCACGANPSCKCEK